MVIVKLKGGLGNQMFQYASGRSIAEKCRMVLKMDTRSLLDRSPREEFVFRDYDLDIFNISGTIATEDEINRVTSNYSSVPGKITGRLKRFFNNPVIRESQFNYMPLPTREGKHIYLDGYWQSEKYFKDIEDIIRKEFTFREGLSANCQELANEIQSENSICINVRRADFITIAKASEFHGFCGVEYILPAIDLMVGKVSNPHFYVFSDDIEWCKENIPLSYPCTFVGHEFAGKKFQKYLHLMMLCKHFIIPNSTFAWWAAWLSESEGKQVIAPKLWFRDSSVNTNDLIPSTWMRI